jgi:hypothetical protein
MIWSNFSPAAHLMLMGHPRPRRRADARPKCGEPSLKMTLASMMGHEATPPVIFTGGVALILGMAEALADTLGTPVQIAPEPQMTGAIGAALLACRQLRKA